MRIAVTGAAGMLGQAVTTAAERLGHDVDGFDIAGGGHEVLDITDEPASRIECSTSARSMRQSSPMAVYGPM